MTSDLTILAFDVGWTKSVNSSYLMLLFWKHLPKFLYRLNKGKVYYKKYKCSVCLHTFDKKFFYIYFFGINIFLYLDAQRSGLHRHSVICDYTDNRFFTFEHVCRIAVDCWPRCCLVPSQKRCIHSFIALAFTFVPFWFMVIWYEMFHSYVNHGNNNMNMNIHSFQQKYEYNLDRQLS
jgi:hypothetical protein